MDIQPFFTEEERKDFFSKYRQLVRSLYSFLHREEEEQVMEVLRIDGRIAGIQIGSLQQALNDQRDICVERLFDLFQCNDLFQHRAIEQEGDDRSPFHT